jgi:serine/threonine protein kinase
MNGKKPDEPSSSSTSAGDPDASFPELLRSRYVPRRLLGEGAMGAVFLAQDGNLGREVAVKLMRCSATTAARRRFEREARALAEIRHTSVVEVYDYGVTDQGPYLVMEYLTGRSLDQPGIEVDPARVLEAISDALNAVHAAGLVHRDVKPANMVQTTDGRIVLTDFGLAFDPDVTRMTAEGAATGTLGYMAPEILRAGTPTFAVDLWALGVTTYELAEGRLPYQAKEVIAAATGHSFPPVRFARLDEQGPLARAIRDLLIEDPDRRRLPQAAGARTDSQPAPGSERPPPSTATAIGPPRPPMVGRSPGALGAALLIGVAALTWSQRPGASAPSAAPLRPQEPPSRTDPTAEVQAAANHLIAHVQTRAPHIATGDRIPVEDAYRVAATLEFGRRLDHLYRAAAEALPAKDSPDIPRIEEIAAIVRVASEQPILGLSRVADMVKNQKGKTRLAVELFGGTAAEEIPPEWDPVAVLEQTDSARRAVAGLLCRLDPFPLEFLPEASRLGVRLATTFHLFAEAPDSGPGCSDLTPNRARRYMESVTRHLRDSSGAEATEWAIVVARAAGGVQDTGALEAAVRSRALDLVEETLEPGRLPDVKARAAVLFWVTKARWRVSLRFPREEHEALLSEAVRVYDYASVDPVVTPPWRRELAKEFVRLRENYFHEKLPEADALLARVRADAAR